ncbi:MAG: hypothetical protein QG635_2467, partial [Bacteroidota bacterium]|nr:hypothetical protein [Bacteroidota bacterium]
MLKVLIHGIKDGLHDIELTADAADIPD